MASKILRQMESHVRRGYSPAAVWNKLAEGVYNIGTELKINKNTTGKALDSDAPVSIPAGTLVSVESVGDDPVVRLQDGRVVVVPFADVGESIRSPCRFRRKMSEMELSVVVNVVLKKPLPQGALDWIKGGYVDYGVLLPARPAKDTDKDLAFPMKAEHQEMLDAAIEELKNLAGAAFVSATPGKVEDFDAANLVESAQEILATAKQFGGKEVDSQAGVMELAFPSADEAKEFEDAANSKGHLVVSVSGSTVYVEID